MIDMISIYTTNRYTISLLFGTLSHLVRTKSCKSCRSSPCAMSSTPCKASPCGLSITGPDWMVCTNSSNSSGNQSLHLSKPCDATWIRNETLWLKVVAGENPFKNDYAKAMTSLAPAFQHHSAQKRAAACFTQNCMTLRQMGRSLAKLTQVSQTARPKMSGKAVPLHLWWCSTHFPVPVSCRYLCLHEISSPSDPTTWSEAQAMNSSRNWPSLEPSGASSTKRPWHGSASPSCWLRCWYHLATLLTCVAPVVCCNKYFILRGSTKSKTAGPFPFFLMHTEHRTGWAHLAVCGGSNCKNLSRFTASIGSFFSFDLGSSKSGSKSLTGSGSTSSSPLISASSSFQGKFPIWAERQSSSRSTSHSSKAIWQMPQFPKTSFSNSSTELAVTIVFSNSFQPPSPQLTAPETIAFLACQLVHLWEVRLWEAR